MRLFTGSARIAMLLVLCFALQSAAQPDASTLGPAPRDADGRFTNTIGALMHGGYRQHLFASMHGLVTKLPHIPKNRM